MQKIKHLVLSTLIALGIALAPLTTSYGIGIKEAKDATAGGACEQKGGKYDAVEKKCDKKNTDITGIFRTVANILLFLVGAIAVIMLIVGGFRYVVSGGDAGATKGAKDTIMYAIIGIVVAFLAYAAVNFVTDQLTKGTTTATSIQRFTNIT